MPDLNGVPLPYTDLDAAIERLFGPTVVRRKMLHPGIEDLAPVCEGGRGEGGVGGCVPRFCFFHRVETFNQRCMCACV